ncbi:MAG: hypothetical protein HDR29_01900 [Lachnospiraceae bacterium]|nr:hypothetical protein [Lachnospiraceae bacterium]
MTIKDYKENSENDIEIVVKILEDDCDPMGKILFEGCLGDCPKELDELKVDICGRSWKAAQKGELLLYLEHIEENEGLRSECLYQMSKSVSAPCAAAHTG